MRDTGTRQPEDVFSEFQKKKGTMVDEGEEGGNKVEDCSTAVEDDNTQRLCTQKMSWQGCKNIN